MGEITHGWHRGASVVGFFITVGIWLLVAFALRPRRRSNLTNTIPMRDLELGNPYIEREREHDCERGLANPEDYGIFGNPWNNDPWRRSEDFLATPKPVMRSLSHEPHLSGRDRGLPDPEMFDVPLHDDLVQVPPPAQQRLNPAGVLLGLGGRLVRWKAQTTDRKRKGKDPEIERLPDVPTAIPDVVAQPAAASTARSDIPFPRWLVERKASDGPRNARFQEVDVGGPSVIPPDHDFVAMQLDLISRAPISIRPGLNRGCTWHGNGDDFGEGPSRPAVVRNQTSHL